MRRWFPNFLLECGVPWVSVPHSHPKQTRRLRRPSEIARSHDGDDDDDWVGGKEEILAIHRWHELIFSTFQNVSGER